MSWAWDKCFWRRFRTMKEIPRFLVILEFSFCYILKKSHLGHSIIFFSCQLPLYLLKMYHVSNPINNNLAIARDFIHYSTFKNEIEKKLRKRICVKCRQPTPWIKFLKCFCIEYLIWYRWSTVIILVCGWEVQWFAWDPIAMIACTWTQFFRHPSSISILIHA